MQSYLFLPSSTTFGIDPHSEKIGKFYIGHTEDINKRLLRHNKGQVTSTRGKGPWTIVYQEYFPSRAEAVQRELEIKSKRPVNISKG